jgi:hypothetical protein
VERAERSGSPEPLDLTVESDPDSNPSRRGEAVDIAIVGEREKRTPRRGKTPAGEREPECDTELEIRIIRSRTTPAHPRTEAFLAPALVLSTCIETEATSGTTFWATATAVVISVATHLAGRSNQ